MVLTLSQRLLKHILELRLQNFCPNNSAAIPPICVSDKLSGDADVVGGQNHLGRPGLSLRQLMRALFYPGAVILIAGI